MRIASATLLVFLGGFAIMVLEIIGARYLARDFGGSFYVWISQIGVVLVALSLGYAVGGALADYLGRLIYLGMLLIPAGLATIFVPDYAGWIIDLIVGRHPLGEPIPSIWQKLDPVIGSALVFFLPCFVLAMLSPYIIRLSSQRLTVVGRISGMVYAASTVGSIAGVFVSGYILIDYMRISHIFRATGGLTIGLGLMCWGMDRWFRITKGAADET